MMESKRVNLGWKKCVVDDHVHITRCYKCCGFSHISTECKNKLACSKCGGQHKHSECRSKNMKCVNCSEMNKQFNLKIDCDHHAMSYKCETFQRKLVQLSKRIQYKEAE